jgi:hypothetical protein
MNTSKQELLALIERIKKNQEPYMRYFGPTKQELIDDPILNQLWEQYAVYATLKGIPII